MGKLHFFRSSTPANNTDKPDFNGDGEVNDTGQEFTVTNITGDTVSKTASYQIKQGQGTRSEAKYTCTALTNGPGKRSATFKIISTTKAAVTAPSSSRGWLVAAALEAAARAAQKTVVIEIAIDDLKELKKDNYKLCFAKKIGDEDYNVVWQSYTRYDVTNSFSWEPRYQLFGSNQFIDQVTVQTSTNLVSIGLGQSSVLDESGVLEEPSTGGPKISITMMNKYESIHPGVTQLSTGITGTQISTPIYIAPEPIVLGNVVLTPVEKVLVWFEQDIETSTMFSAARSNAIEIDLTLSDAEKRLYEGQQWSTPPAG